MTQVKRSKTYGNVIEAPGLMSRKAKIEYNSIRVLIELKIFETFVRWSIVIRSRSVHVSDHSIDFLCPYCELFPIVFKEAPVNYSQAFIHKN